MSFTKYYEENMKAMGLPTPEGIYSGTATAGATATAILKNAAKYGSRVTVAELIGAGILGESSVAAMGVAGLEASLGLLAAYYAGANIGSLAVATGKTLSDNFDAYALLHPEDYKDFEDWQNAINRDGKYHVYDPLALDLDGNGIQTIATNGFSGSLFDHNKDGIRAATGWVASGDGLLVRDLNGNGQIDNGGELFGDSTVLADGSLAQHGYAALAQLDSNADGLINESDNAFGSLKVWQDKNQDGISQADELHTLADLGIQALNTAYTDVNQNLGNGNSIAQLGSYTKTDGSTAQMADLLFASDNLYSRFTEKIDLTPEQAQAANLDGIGRLRDLREAAVLSKAGTFYQSRFNITQTILMLQAA